MKSYRLNIENIIVITSITTMLVFATIMLIFHWAELEKLWELVLHYGLIIIVPTLLWKSIENYFWRVSWFRKLFRSLINIPPDLRGRWEGKIDQDKKDTTSITFVLEINQTLTRTHIDTYLGRNISHSHFATITTRDEFNKLFTVCYLYEADSSSGIFYGFTYLDFNDEDGQKELRGNYFSEKKPVQSRDEINLKWV